MANIDIAIERGFSTPADTDSAWALLADTRATLAHYPKLDKLVDLGDDRWRWELQAIGIKNVTHQLIYSVRYTFKREAGLITWTPISADTDNAQVQGQFQITAQDGGSHIVLSTDVGLAVPAPQLLAGAIKPLVEREFREQIEVFVANLGKALGND